MFWNTITLKGLTPLFCDIFTKLWIFEVFFLVNKGAISKNINTWILATQRIHNCTWNNCSIWTDVEVFYMVWEKIDLEFITKYSLPKMFRILFWMEVGTTRVRVYCIMHASTKIKFNLKWLICLEHLLEFEPNLQPSSPNFKYSVTKYFLTLSICWSQSRNIFIMLIQAQVYIITLTLSHEYFRNRKQETNYHILSVSQESFALCIMIFCMHIAHFLVNIVSLDKQRRPVVTKL